MIDTKMTFARNNSATAGRRAAAALPLSLSIAIVAATLITAAPAPVFARDVLFLGVTDVRGEPARPELEGELRAELAADGRFRLIGAVETERVVREMERRGHTRAEAVIPAGAGLSDSTVIVVGAVKELSVITKRSSLLLWGKIDAKMRLEVNLRELSGKSAHRGEFSASASKRKDVILFQDPKKVVHVSAADREELVGRMRAELVKSAVDLVATFFNALASGGLPPKAASKGGADTAAAAPDSGAEFSTVDGTDVAPIDSAGGAADGGK